MEGRFGTRPQKPQFRDKDESVLVGLKVYDLEELKGYFLSKKKAKDVTAPPEYGYCDKAKAIENDQESVVIASFVRSGNTMFRSYMEKITGLMTGSNGNVGIGQIQDLEDMGFKGEAINDKRCWLVKTHFPEFGSIQKMHTEKALVVVRSPLDMMVSGLNQALTGSHDKRLDDEDFKIHSELWTQFCDQEITVWKEFHEFWQKVNIPVYFVRFEDMLTDPLSTFTGVMQFLLHKQSLKGMVIEKILQIVCGQQPPQMYQPRLGKFNQNFDKYSSEQIERYYAGAKEVIDKFGYQEVFTGQPQENPKQFLVQWNEDNLKKAIDSDDNEDITTLFINDPTQIIRCMSTPEYPEGRNIIGFQQAFEGKVRIYFKTGQLCMDRYKI